MRSDKSKPYLDALVRNDIYFVGKEIRFVTSELFFVISEVNIFKDEINFVTYEINHTQAKYIMQKLINYAFQVNLEIMNCEINL